MEDEKKPVVTLDQLKVQYADLQLLRETLAEQLNIVNQKMLGLKQQIKNETLEHKRPED